MCKAYLARCSSANRPCSARYKCAFAASSSQLTVSLAPRIQCTEAARKGRHMSSATGVSTCKQGKARVGRWYWKIYARHTCSTCNTSTRFHALQEGSLVSSFIRTNTDTCTIYIYCTQLLFACNKNTCVQLLVCNFLHAITGILVFHYLYAIIAAIYVLLCSDAWNYAGTHTCRNTYAYI